MVCARFVREVMTNRELTQLEVARRLGHDNNGLVAAVLGGKRPIPWDDLDRWAAALELSPEQTRLLKRYAIKSYGPACAVDFLDALDEAQARIGALDAEQVGTAKRVETLERYAEALERENAELRARLQAQEPKPTPR
jgi:transcriptional regulator with XRE-family HTH domain